MLWRPRQDYNGGEAILDYIVNSWLQRPCLNVIVNSKRKQRTREETEIICAVGDDDSSWKSRADRGLALNVLVQTGAHRE